MVERITTVLGLPGSGKSFYCKQEADKLEILGYKATWRPEPTDDVPNFIRAGMSSEQISRMVLTRFTMCDREPSFADFIWRDSDYYTSLLIFGGEPIPSAKYIIKSTHLVYLRIGPELQKQRILKRNRPIAQQELMYCSEEWHTKAEEAFKKYPCAKKQIIEVEPSS